MKPANLKTNSAAIVLCSISFFSASATEPNWEEVQAVIDSVEASGAAYGLGEFTGLPNTFLGQVFEIGDDSIKLVFESYHQKDEYIDNLKTHCSGDNPRENSETLILMPEVASLSIACSSFEEEDRRSYFTFAIVSGRIDDSLFQYQQVIVSLIELPRQTWRQRTPTQSELGIAKAYQRKHVPTTYDSEYYEFDSQVSVIETEHGRFMLLPLLDVIGEFVTPLGLIVRESSDGRWEEYHALHGIPRAMWDIDGDGFPEFYGGDQYDYGLWKLYPTKTVLLRGGL